MIANPAQLWRTHAALAQFYAEQGKNDAARRAAGDAGRVVDGVLAGLSDEALRASLQGSPLVRALRDRAREA